MMGSVGPHININPLDKTIGNGRQRILRPFLAALSAVYGGAQKLHADTYRWRWRPIRRLPCAVISVGNLVAGGTGKTPLTHYLAALCRRFGYQVAILSRGYRGKCERKGGMVSDDTTLLMSAEEAGDEPYLLASALGIPVLVGRDRFRSGCLALERFHPDVILLDDGFQHLKLARDLDILLLDESRPLGNGHLLPRGPLREPPTGIGRADAVVLTRCDPGDSESEPTKILPVSAKRYLEDKPLFRSFHEPVVDHILPSGQRRALVDRLAEIDQKIVAGQRVYAFSGIARNDDFHRGVRQLGGNIVGHQMFADHHAYDQRDFSHICRAAVTSGADYLATTAKDYARIGSRVSFPLDLVVVNVAVRFSNSQFDSFVTHRLAGIISAQGVRR